MVSAAFTLFCCNSPPRGGVPCPMPRFYFHFQNDSGRTQDAEGIILPDDEAAWFQAVRSARDLYGDDVLERTVEPDLRVEIQDEEGRCVLDSPLQDVMRLPA